LEPPRCSDESVASASDTGGVRAAAASLPAAARGAVGYTGGARLIALWASPFGDELMISDGTLTETGHWRGWLCFCQHPLAHLFLEPYRLGDSDDEGEHRLLVDRHLARREVSCGKPGLGRGGVLCRVERAVGAAVV
jgi:hypothetical protein